MIKSKICTVSNHLIKAEHYCELCYEIICLKCFKKHEKHKVVAVKQLYSKLNNLTNEKEKNLEVFTSDIQTQYDQQVATITSFFRDLHDQLYFKEVELKRELKSHYDDNLEQYTTVLSNLDQNIDLLNKITKEYENMNQPQQQQQQENNIPETPPITPAATTTITTTTPTIATIPTPTILLDQLLPLVPLPPQTLLQKLGSALSEISINPFQAATNNNTIPVTSNNNINNNNNNNNILKNEQTLDYQILSLNEHSSNVKGAINSIEFIRQRYCYFKNNQLERKNLEANYYLYRFGNISGVERVNIVTRERKIILTPEEASIGCPSFTDQDGYFYQNNSCNQQIVIIGYDKYFQLDCSKEYPVWKSGPFPINSEKLRYQSSIYDGKDSIFVIGGYSSDTINGFSGSSIFQFNIHTCEFKLVAQLPNPSRIHGLHYYNNYIYIFGGYNKKKLFLNEINGFNTLTYQFEKIIPTAYEKSKYNHFISGCIDYHHNCLYFISSKPVFYRYDMNTKTSSVLPTPIEQSTNSKMYFDGDHSIYLVLRSIENSVHCYNIKDGTWKLIDKLFSTVGGINDYISFSNI
ncbi:hypothetical protein DLAC_07199 [Tieghemostelium lacteum]|uniref:B box-type domain-containing protein n=1 Tax=Tieghemostelium lacteum TaxID=361077 RepID=A0A151ZDC1_TIELA|nr:hypothetical protein DLAC_07199 [Tieghemostelium lacteum]|eukprot:KYQ91958.1 hypothetical protein DLAC_07199 [Tieghemostelium lacteum]